MFNQHRRLFFSHWLRNPLGIGSVAPSGRSLARAMAGQLGKLAGGAVVELGGGTGAVTAALLEAGVPQRDLVVVERNPELQAFLARRFPQVHVLGGDATELAALLTAAGVVTVTAVVSSLPLLAMPSRTVRTILQQSFAVMGSEGRFIQYTYGPGSPVPETELQQLGLRGEPEARIWRNIPPATVWRITASPDAAAKPMDGRAQSDLTSALH